MIVSFLVITVGYPVAVDQGWTHYNPYILPLVALGAWIFGVVFVVSTDFCHRYAIRLVGSQKGRTAVLTAASFAVIGAGIGAVTGVGYFFAIQTSKEHLASLQTPPVPPESKTTVSPVPKTPESHPGQGDILPTVRDSIGVMLNPAQRGIPKQLSFTTGGVGEQEFSFDAHPTKILFEPPMSVVEEKELPKEIEIAGKHVSILRFTGKGFILDDHHVSVSGKAILLEAVPPKPKQQKQQPLPESRSDSPFAEVAIVGSNNTPQVQVTNIGAGANFYARLEINGPVGGPKRDIFGKWAHTDTVKAWIAKGDTCRLDVAHLDWDTELMFSQWKIFAVIKDHGTRELSALYSSCAKSEPLIRAGDIFVNVSIIAEPDLQNGIQKTSVRLTAFGADIPKQL